MIAIKQISGFLKTVEGSYNVGYVPCWLVGTDRKKSKNYKGAEEPELFEAMYSSGVTIGVGCDLGQTSQDDLLEYGLSPLVVTKLLPYIGKKKASSLAILHSLPLSMSEEEVEALNQAVHLGYLTKYVVPGYNRDAYRQRFDTLPAVAQCCIASMCYQKGVGGVRRDFSNTWKALCRCDWKDAYNRLTNPSLWKDFKSRRNLEGLLLKGIF